MAMRFKKTDLTFGIEIECGVPRNLTVTAASTISHTRTGNCAFAGFDDFNVSTDGSLRNDNSNMKMLEFVSPVLQYGKSDMDRAHGFVKTLKDNGAFVNDSCGGHVHIGLQNIKAKMSVDEWTLFLIRLVTNFARIESALYMINGGDKRKTGSYCRPLQSTAEKISNGFVFESIAGLMGDRYYGLNLASIAKHGTVEFRIFAGSVNPNVWIDNVKLACTFVLATANHRSYEQMAEKDVDRLIDIFGLDRDNFRVWRKEYRSEEMRGWYRAFKTAFRTNITSNPKAAKLYKSLAKRLHSAVQANPDQTERIQIVLLHLYRILSCATDLIVTNNMIKVATSNGELYSIGKSGREITYVCEDAHSTRSKRIQPESGYMYIFTYDEDSKTMRSLLGL